MEIKTVEREPFTVVGLKYRGRNENAEIPQLWRDLGPHSGEIEHIADDTVAYGISANMDAATGAFDYVAGFAVSRTGDVPAGMIAFEVPGGRYAVFTTTLPEIGETFQRAYHTWLPGAGYRPTGGPEFELYDGRFDEQDPSSEFDLYIPIE
ncbi:MAG: GyrI-like domain-containing protein [Anaerolineae bacterium]|jgi:AraC family transcriptional regulator